jgi:hypothetical protein
MATETIITVMIIGLLVMVGVAFVIHTVERNRREKRRQEALLHKRASNLQYMLDSFPQNFLGSELKVLVCQSLLNIYEQLKQIEPGKREYTKRSSAISQRIQEFAKQKNQASYQPLNSPEQIKEIKNLLEMLNTFIIQLLKQKSISKEQANNYTVQLQQLMHQTSIDTYSIAARDAESKGKYKLAIHYYQSALDKLRKQNLEGIYHHHALAYQQKIEELRLQSKQSPTTLAEEQAGENKPQDKEWDKFLDSDEDDWKKKNVYD